MSLSPPNSHLLSINSFSKQQLSCFLCILSYNTRWTTFNIFLTINARWSTMKTREAEGRVGGATNLFMVLATVAKNACMGLTFIINHVPNYPLGCTIPCTQNILLFSLAQRDMKTKNFRTKMSNAKSAKKMVIGNRIIVVQVAILTLTSDALIHHSPWNLKSTTTH